MPGFSCFNQQASSHSLLIIIICFCFFISNASSFFFVVAGFCGGLVGRFSFCDDSIRFSSSFNLIFQFSDLPAGKPFSLWNK
jgi:hypothetical protein